MAAVTLETLGAAMRERIASTRPRLILAIDPGNEHSGWAVVDIETRFPLRFGKTPNDELRAMIRVGYFEDCERAYIEMVRSYGMAVGAEVFETCVWIGRYQELIDSALRIPSALVYRGDVKVHLCHTSRAKDSNVRQALVDRFAHGQPNYGKGTKKAPGFFYGFSADVWQAYALGVYAADSLQAGQL